MCGIRSQSRSTWILYPLQTSTELLTSTNTVDRGYLITAKVGTNESFYKQPELLPSLFMPLLFQISKCCKN